MKTFKYTRVEFELLYEVTNAFNKSQHKTSMKSINKENIKRKKELYL